MLQTLRRHRWLVGALSVAVVLLAGGVAWIGSRIPSDAELATRIESEFEQRFGIGLQVGRVHWALRPVPVVVVEDIRTAQAQPVTIRRIAVRPRLRALWDRVVSVDEIEIDGAVLPRASVRAFRGRTAQARDAETTGARWTFAPVPVEHVRFTDVSWIDRRGIALAYDGRIDFDAAWRPRTAEIARAGLPDASPPARLRLEREGQADRWRAQVDVGGGTWNGQATLEDRSAAGGAHDYLLRARLDARDVDIATLVASFKREAALQGRLQGSTDVTARGADVGEMVRSLHTRTRFAVNPATLMRFDLAKAVRTAGTDRSGRTVLDELTGTLDTQTTDAGVQMTYTGLTARSGLLTASGSVQVFNRKLDGELAIDLVDGVVGVPLKLGGTLDKPELSLTGGALAGAAIGTALLPGVGTAIGARLGQRVERLFGGGPKRDKSGKGAASASRKTPR